MFLIMITDALAEGLTNDVSVDVYLAVLLCQLKGLVVAARQHQEVDG